jgi:hypothetical protein
MGIEEKNPLYNATARLCKTHVLNSVDRMVKAQVYFWTSGRMARLSLNP